MVQRLKRSKKLIIANHPREVLLGASGLLENSTILLLLDSDETEYQHWKRWLMGICKDMFIPLYTCGLSAEILRTLPEQKLKSCIESAVVGDYDYVIFARSAHSARSAERAICEIFCPASNIKGLLSFSLEAHDKGIIVPSNPSVIEGYAGFAKPLFAAIKEYRAYIGKSYGFQYGDDFRVEYLRG